MSCDTCRRAYCCHVATECLSGGPAGGPYPYKHHEPGDPAAELHAGELLGAVPIHLSGEAEVTNGRPPDEQRRRLWHIGEQCGYMVGEFDHGRQDTALRLDVFTLEGEFRVWWNCTDPYKPAQVARIDRISATTGLPVRTHWQP